MISSLVPFPDGAQAVLTYSMPGIPPVRNRLWFQNRQPPTTGTQLQALADGLAALWSTDIMPLLAPELNFGLVDVYQWDSPGFGSIGFAAPGVAGGASSSSHSANVSIRVRFDWAGPVNARLGSNFVPGIPEDAVSVNTIEPSFAEALRSAYVGVIDAAPTWGPFPAWRWVNASLQFNYAPRPSAFVRAVTFVTVPSPLISPRRMRTR